MKKQKTVNCNHEIIIIIKFFETKWRKKMNTESAWNEIEAHPQPMSTIKASRSTSNIATS